MDILVTHKIWNARVWLNGQPYQLVDLPTRSIGLRRSTCSIPVLGLPALIGGEIAIVDISLNGVWTRFFTGVVEQRSAKVAPITRTVQIIDEMRKLNQTPQTAITWSSTSFPDAVTDLLEAAGITNIGDIHDPDLPLGTEYDIVIGTDENLDQVMSELMDYGGTAIYSDQNGQMQVIDNPGIPTEFGALRYVEGADYSNNEYGFYGAEEVVSGLEQIIAVYTASGPTREDGVTPTFTFTATGITGASDGKEYRFIQTAAVAETIAERECSRRARTKRIIYLEGPINPDLHPGQTLLLTCSLIGYADDEQALVETIDTLGVDMRVVLNISPSLIDGFTLQKPPVTDFSMMVEVEPIVIDGTPETRYLVQCTDLSYDPDGEILNREWTPSAGGTPASSTDTNPLFMFESIESATISLEVEDNDGFITTATKPVPNGATEVLTRQISIACGAVGWKILWDGTAGFTTYERAGQECLSVPPFNELGQLIAGWDDGLITYTDDDRVIHDLFTLDGAINALFVNEGDANHILAGHDNKLSRSTDAGTAFTMLFEFEAPVNEVQSSPFALDEIRVASGNMLYLSFDAANFEPVIENGDPATICESFATAPWGHAAVFSNFTDLEDAFLTEENQDVDWSGAIPQPSNLLSISAMLETEGFFVGDDQGNVYSLTLEGSTYTALFVDQTDAMTGSANDMIRDGTLPALTYIADDAGLHKLLNNIEIFQADLDEALQVGYGKLSAATTPVGVMILRPTWGITGAERGVQVYDPATGTWSAKNNGLPAGAVFWRQIVAHPTDGETKWAMLGNTDGDNPDFYIVTGDELLMADGVTKALWYTSDGGATFAAVDVDVLPGISSRRIMPGCLEWSGDKLYIAGINTTGGQDGSWLFSGTPPADLVLQVSSYTPGENNFDFITMTAGLNSSVLIADNEQVVYVPSSSAVFAATSGVYNANAYIDKLAGLSRVALLMNPTTLTVWRNSDYLANTFIDTAFDVEQGTWLSAGIGVAYIGGRSFDGNPLHGGIYKISNAAGTLTGAVVIGANITTGHVRVGRQRREAVAGIFYDGSGTTDIYVSEDGATWITLEGPGAGLTASDLSNWVEVVEIGG